MLFSDFTATAAAAKLLVAAKVITAVGTAMITISPAVENLRDEFDTRKE